MAAVTFQSQSDSKCLKRFTIVALQTYLYLQTAIFCKYGFLALDCRLHFATPWHTVHIKMQVTGVPGLETLNLSDTVLSSTTDHPY